MKHPFVSAIVASIVIACASPLLAFTPHSPVFVQDDAAQTQTVKADEDFFIALPSNRTTGFAWTASIADSKLVAYEGNVYQRPSHGMPGAGGQQLFIFHANRSGSTTIIFSYARPFDTNAAPARSLTFNLTVE